MVRKAIFVAAMLGMAVPATADVQVEAPQDPLVAEPAPPPKLSQDEIDLLYDLLKGLPAPAPVELIHALRMQRFYTADIDGAPGFGTGDAARLEALAEARTRAQLTTRLIADDIDGDGKVTRDELITVGKVDSARQRPIRQGGTASGLDADQLAVLAETFALQQLEARDLNGDGAIDVDDIDLALHDARRDSRLSALVPPFGYDEDGDGITTEAEMQRVLDRWLGWADEDGDDILSRSEVQTRLNLVRRADQALNRSSGPGRNTCNLPPLPPAHEVVVVHGEGGTAFVDLNFSGTRAPVEMAEIVVPAGKTSLWIVASFRTPMVLRLAGDAERVAGIVSVAAPVGVTGGRPDIAIAVSRCHVGFLGMVMREPGQSREDVIARRFATALRRESVAIHMLDRVGRFDLATGRNETRERLSGDDTPEAEGPARLTLDALYRFSPGGFHDLSPEDVVVPNGTRVTEPTLLPFEAGLLQLIDAGHISPVTGPKSGVIRRIPPGEATPGGNARRFSPVIDGLIYRKTEDGGWIGVEPLTFSAKVKPRIPRGLEGPRGIKIIVSNRRNVDTMPTTCERRGFLSRDRVPGGNDCLSTQEHIER